MLDARYYKQDLDELKQALKNRGADLSVADRLHHLGEDRSKAIQSAEELKAKRNTVTKEIAQLKKESKSNPNAQEQAEKKIAEMKALGEEIKSLSETASRIDEEFRCLALHIPNIPSPQAPIGADESQNVEIKKHGSVREFSYPVKDHVDLGEGLGILDFERAVKLSGSRFSVLRGAGARLERALTQFMLDLHTKEHGYEEMTPPYIVNEETMTGTGQLPKFEEDLFKTHIGEKSLYLIPTAEVPLTNFFADEILREEDLPYRFTAFTPCFRSEAGSYGKDTRGLIRQHQFHKVELVKIVHPENSYQELDEMVKNAERVLEKLGLPYRTLKLCTGDMGFGAALTFDLEVWLPSQNTYREISSCSNCEDFQARRAKIRYRDKTSGKNLFPHTLNGSGLAVGRTLLAILENYQLEDGSVEIPSVLEPYVEGSPGFTRSGKRLILQKLSK